MRKIGAFSISVCLVVLWGFTGIYAQDDLEIWREFVETLKSGRLTVDQIRPYEGMSREGKMERLQYLMEVSNRNSSWKEWEETPEIFPVENQVHFLIPLGFGGMTKTDYCFTFLKEEDRWYYRHMENITIRLDKTPEPPTSEFPDVSQDMKTWQRQEFFWSKMVYFYTVLTREKGKDFFPNLMRDGAGYYLMAKTWVPVVPPQRAFVLYLCWEQSRLRGNKVTLEVMTDQEAVIRIQTHFFALYKITGHLKNQISFEDYRRIFETIWQDRAVNAGWNLDITYEDPEGLECVFHLKSM